MARAPVRSGEEAGRPEREFFCFRVGDLELGVPSEHVREVMRVGVLTPLPRVPSFLLGVCGHRGEVLPVMDLLRFLGQGEMRSTSRSRLFVGTAAEFQVGLLADAVRGLERIGLEEIQAPPVGGDLAAEHFIGLWRRPGKPLRSLLDLEKILAAAQRRLTPRPGAASAGRMARA